MPVSKRRHIGDRILGSSFFEGSNYNPQSPICDAIIDFGDLSRHSHSPETKDIAGDVSFDVFDLSSNAFIISDSIITPELIESEYATGSRRSVQPNLQTSYPSPTQTISGDAQLHSTLPAFIHPLPKNMSAEDMEYLSSRGAFDLPDAPIRDMLLQAYAKWVHPFTPMLNLKDIVSGIFSNGTRATVSLLVFQSMMFAATAFFADAGCGSQKKMRKAFYDRARLLHDFDVETDRLAISQAAILLSFWDGDLDCVRDSYYWIGIASLHATSIGLDFDHSPRLAQPNRQRALKLTWWSLLIRDRLLAVAMRRPVQNKAFRFDVPMMVLEDFELESLHQVLQDALQVQDISMSELEVLACSCMALAQLSEYIDKILSAQYTSQRAAGGPGQCAPVVSLVPKVAGSKCADITRCGQELQNWYGYLPTEVQQLDERNNEPPSEREHELIQVHKSLLAGYYSMTLMTLYRPLVNLPSTSTNDVKLRTLSMKMVSRAARSITDIFGGLYADNLITRLPDTAIAALEPAVATHLLYSMSEAAHIRETSIQKFYLCWRILLQFGKTYFLAEATMTMLNAAAQRLKTLPDLKSSKPAACSLLVDEVCSTNDSKSTAHVAVPFVGVVGNQKEENPHEATSWIALDGAHEQFEAAGRAVDNDDHVFDLGANGALDTSSFDQLVCWDDLAGNDGNINGCISDLT